MFWDAMFGDDAACQVEDPPDAMSANVVRLEELGHGATGCVYKAVHATSLQLLAVKEVGAPWFLWSFVICGALLRFLWRLLDCGFACSFCFAFVIALLPGSISLSPPPTLPSVSLLVH